MIEQLSLEQAASAPVDRRRLTPKQRWERFCHDNPHAQGEIVLTTAALIEQGVRATIAVVWEELRTRIRTNGDPYRWDNSLRAPAAAWLRDEWPELAGHMRTRRSR